MTNVPVSAEDRALIERLGRFGGALATLCATCIVHSAHIRIRFLTASGLLGMTEGFHGSMGGMCMFRCMFVDRPDTHDVVFHIAVTDLPTLKFSHVLLLVAVCGITSVLFPYIAYVGLHPSRILRAHAESSVSGAVYPALGFKLSWHGPKAQRNKNTIHQPAQRFLTLLAGCRTCGLAGVNCSWNRLEASPLQFKLFGYRLSVGGSNRPGWLCKQPFTAVAALYDLRKFLGASYLERASTGA